jgi:cell division protein FtsN
VAAKRGKSQARRNGGRGNGGGDHGLPLWAWGVLIGVLVAVGVLVAPKLLHGTGGDGFFRPAPNPDAQPAPVAEDDAVADDTPDTATAKKSDEAGKPKSTQYDFYKLLPGNEVPMSDAEVDATARAEAARAAAATPSPTPSAAGDTDDRSDAPTVAANDAKPAPTPASVGDAKPVATAAPEPQAPKANDTPYLIQAGAFGASGDAEALKAKIALLGLGARVESAQLAGKTVYRVRMGPYGTASELADAKRKLTTGGLPAMAIRAK